MHQLLVLHHSDDKAIKISVSQESAVRDLRCIFILLLHSVPCLISAECRHCRVQLILTAPHSSDEAQIVV